MNEAQSTASPGPERLTWSEICQRYPDEWVVLVEIEWFDDDNLEFGRAVVLGHAKNSKEVMRQTKPLLAEVMDSGIFFTGRVRPLPPFFPR